MATEDQNINVNDNKRPSSEEEKGEEEHATKKQKFVAQCTVDGDKFNLNIDAFMENKFAEIMNGTDFGDMTDEQSVALAEAATKVIFDAARTTKIVVGKTLEKIAADNKAVEEEFLTNVEFPAGVLVLMFNEDGIPRAAVSVGPIPNEHKKFVINPEVRKDAQKCREFYGSLSDDAVWKQITGVEEINTAARTAGITIAVKDTN